MYMHPYTPVFATGCPRWGQTIGSRSAIGTTPTCGPSSCPRNYWAPSNVSGCARGRCPPFLGGCHLWRTSPVIPCRARGDVTVGVTGMGCGGRRGSVRAGCFSADMSISGRALSCRTTRFGARWCRTYAKGWASTTFCSRNIETRSTACITWAGSLGRWKKKTLPPFLRQFCGCRGLGPRRSWVRREVGRRPGPGRDATAPFGHGSGGRRDKTPLDLQREAVKNKRCNHIPFSMHTVARVASVASQGCFMTSLDDASAFHHVLLRPSSCPLFGFSYGGIYYCWCIGRLAPV